MTTLIPIEHVARRRRGVVLRRGRQFGEASPLTGRSKESFDDVVRAIALGEPAPPSLDFGLWALDAKRGGENITSQILLEDVNTALVMARAALARGHRAFKVKIRSSDDALVLDELRALAPHALLRVDANLAFARESLVPWDRLARASVEWIEEPCPDADALVGAPVAIALDESVAVDAVRAIDAVAEHRVAALVLKPTLLGATETIRIAERCRRLGGRVILSHAFESEVGLAAAEEIARRVAPGEIHGLARWSGIDAYRIATGGAAVRTLLESTEVSRADPALG